MAMVDVGPAAYRRTYSPSRLAWSEWRRPLGAALHSSNEPSELSQWLSRWQHYKHRPGITITITITIIIIIIIIIIKKWSLYAFVIDALFLHRIYFR